MNHSNRAGDSLMPSLSPIRDSCRPTVFLVGLWFTMCVMRMKSALLLSSQDPGDHQCKKASSYLRGNKRVSILQPNFSDHGPGTWS